MTAIVKRMKQSIGAFLSALIGFTWGYGKNVCVKRTEIRMCEHIEMQLTSVYRPYTNTRFHFSR